MYANLINAVKGKNERNLENTILTIQKDNFSGWYTRSFLTKLRLEQFESGIITLDEAIAIAIKKATKEANKSLQIEIDKINEIEKAEDFQSATLNIDWTKSRTWGNCPQCELLGNTRRYMSSRVGGCGYDKESTATSEALNQFNAILKLMYAKKNDNIDINNRKLFGYGSGHGILPSFEGGVGVSTMYDICKSIGLKFSSIASGKSYDVYKIELEA